jgi:ketosteroid isomerase-like protein
MSDPLVAVERLVTATNRRDIEALVACFAPEYVNENPAHPHRGFEGRDQVRRNWTNIFEGVPDLTTRVVASAVDGDEAWTEWEMRGTRRDGSAHAMAGVIIFGIRGDQIASARFYLEPVELTSGDADAAVERAIKPPRP